jgi:hypothetical protein
MAYTLEIDEEERRLLLLAVNHAAQAMSSQFMRASANERREPMLAALFALSKRLGALAEAPERDQVAQFVDIGIPVDRPDHHFSLVTDGETGAPDETGSWLLPTSALAIRATNPDLAAYGIHVGDLILVDTARSHLEGDGLYVLRGADSPRWELLHWLRYHGQPALERGGRIGPVPSEGVEVLGQVIWVLRRPSRPQTATAAPAAPPTETAAERRRAAPVPDVVNCASCDQPFPPARADIERLVEAELAGRPPVLLCPSCQELLRAVDTPAVRPAARRRRLQPVEGSDGH